MEGILPSPCWTVRRRAFSVPYLVTRTYQPRGTSFEHFPQLYGLRRADNAEDLIHGCGTIRQLAVFLQDWLFFKLQSVFLGTDINQAEFVAEGVILVESE